MNLGDNIMTERILRRPEVERLTGLSRTSIYSAMAEGNFPKPIKLGKRAVGWTESSINSWIADKINCSRKNSISTKVS